MTAVDTPPLVTPDNGPRPAGRDDECFYCHQQLGELHLESCVLWTRTVRLRAIIEYTDEVPRSWTAEDIVSARNKSNWCASNLLPEIEALEQEHGCLCPAVRVEIIEE